MPIRMTGMNSGLDTTSIIADLMKAQSSKKDRLQKSQTSLKWEQEAWKSMNMKINTFYTSTLGKLKYSTDYSRKTTSVGDESIAKITAGSDAVLGTQSLAVKQLAKSGYLTGAKITGENEPKVTGASTMAELGVVAAGGTASFKITADGKATSIELNENTTISEVVMQFKNAGVDASFDETNQRFFVSSKTSGKDNDFTMTAEDEAGVKAIMDLGLMTAEDVVNNPEYIKWKGYAGGDDIETAANLGVKGTDGKSEIEKENEKRVAALKERNLVLAEQNVKLEESNGILKKAEEKYLISDEYTKVQKQMPKDNTLEENITELDAEKKQIETDNARLLELQKQETFEPDELEELQELERTSGDRKDKLQKNTENLTVLNNAKAYKTAMANNQIQIDQNVVEYTGNVALLGNDPDGTGSAELTAEITKDLVSQVNAAVDANDAVATLPTGADAAVRINGEDSIIMLNGAEFTSNTNNFSINGLVITAQKLSEEVGGKLQTTDITTSNDVDAIYDIIKDFVKDYSTLMNEISTIFNAEDSGYEPLSEEEKDALSDDEVEKWEQKIKDGSLRKDETLDNVLSSMNDIMTGGVKVGDGTLYLSDFGINKTSFLTTDSNERNAFHIYGNPDDPATMGETDKLRAMISTDPNTVASFFSDLASSLSTSLFDMMSATEASRSSTIYDDIRMEDEYKQYTEDIKAEEVRLLALEDKYYREFGAMETALAKINSSSSAISGMFGG